MDKNSELIEYIVINKDIIKQYAVTPEKLAVHTAHASNLYMFHCLRNAGRETLSRFMEWYNNGKTQKKVLLAADTKQVERIINENKHWTVADIGCNQVPEGTIIAISLGVLTREEKKEIPVVKRLQAFDYKSLFE